jgi:hypothetical protein
MQCIYNGDAVFDWDTNNLRKIRAHRIKAEEVEKALSNDPIPIYEQDVEGKCATSITARQIRGDCWPWYWSSAAKRSESLPRTTWMPGRRRITSPGACEGSEEMMKKKPIVMPKFVNEAQEADWWASREGREFVKQKAAGTGKKKEVRRGARALSVS